MELESNGPLRLLLFKTSQTKILQTLAIRLSRCLGRSPLKSRGSFLVKSLLKFLALYTFTTFEKVHSEVHNIASRGWKYETNVM